MNMRETYGWSFRALLVIVLVLAASWVTVAPTAAADPTVNVSPSSGPIGTMVIVTVCGLTPGDVVVAGNITFGGLPWSTRAVTVDSAGCLGATIRAVAVIPIGPTAITVHGRNVTATGVFTLTQPNVTVSPTSGYKGSTVTISGTGWTSSDVVIPTFQGASLSPLIPDSAGRFSFKFTVPLTAEPSNVISASDHLGNVGAAQLFTLNSPGLSLSPSSGPAGTNVQVHGYGFEPLSGVDDLRIDNVPIPAPGLITNGTGAFVARFEAPAVASGGYIVTATVAGVTRTMNFTIFEPDVWGDAEDGLAVPVETALATVSDDLIRVWGFSHGVWRMYDPADPLGSTLTGLVSGRGYWVKLSRDSTLIFRDLSAGWNNIGW